MLKTAEQCPVLQGIFDELERQLSYHPSCDVGFESLSVLREVVCECSDEAVLKRSVLCAKKIPSAIPQRYQLPRTWFKGTSHEAIQDTKAVVIETINDLDLYLIEVNLKKHTVAGTLGTLRVAKEILLDEVIAALGMLERYVQGEKIAATSLGCLVVTTQFKHFRFELADFIPLLQKDWMQESHG